MGKHDASRTRGGVDPDTFDPRKSDQGPRSGRGWERLVSSAVAPGIWATLMPFPSPLSYSYSYSIQVADGIVVVDLGWDSDAGWSAFEHGLSRAGATMEEIVGVVVTHAHPDHYGLAPRIRENTDVWIATHPLERTLITPTAEARAVRLENMTIWMTASGVPTEHVAALHDEAAEIAAMMVPIEPDIDLADRDIIPGTDGVLQAIHTPGHTAGSMCFFDRERNALMTGDHFLPRVTPNVSKRPESSRAPLADFLSSLDRIGSIGTDPMILPGHEWAFDRRDSRISEIVAHHEVRLDEIEQAVGAGASTTWEVATAVSWSRPFAELEPRNRRQAIGETFAHLHHLVGKGRLRVREGTPTLWFPLPRK